MSAHSLLRVAYPVCLLTTALGLLLLVGCRSQRASTPETSMLLKNGKWGTVRVQKQVPGEQIIEVPSRAPQTRQIPLPARYETVTRKLASGETRTERVLVQPAMTRSIPISSGWASSGYTSTAYSMRAEPAPAPIPDGPATYTDDLSGESYGKVEEQAFKSPRTDPLSTFSIDVDTASYANCRRILESNTQLPPAGAIRLEEWLNAFDYDYAGPVKADRPFAVHTDVGPCPWTPQNRLLRVAMQARELDPAEAPTSHLTFLVDSSGSMNSELKLPLLKRTFSHLLKQLGPEDTVAIVAYASQAGVVLPPTKASKRAKITKALDGLTAKGSTAGADGIGTAYDLARKAFQKGANNRVILATDGDFNVGPQSPDELSRLIKKQAKRGIFLSVLGFGRGNYQDDRMESISNQGNGNYAYIDSMKEAKKVFGRELFGTLHTLAKDVKLQVEFNPEKVAAYRLIGYDNRRLATEDFEDDKKDAGELGAGHRVTAFYEIVPGPAAASTLAFQKNTSVPSALLGKVDCRWKAPDGAVSQLASFPIQDHAGALPDPDFNFASAVVETALVLRESEHAGGADLNRAIARARKALGEDPDGERAEFVRLVKKARDQANDEDG